MYTANIIINNLTDYPTFSSDSLLDCKTRVKDYLCEHLYEDGEYFAEIYYEMNGEYEDSDEAYIIVKNNNIQINF